MFEKQNSIIRRLFKSGLLLFRRSRVLELDLLCSQNTHRQTAWSSGIRRRDHRHYDAVFRFHDSAVRDEYRRRPLPAALRRRGRPQGHHGVRSAGRDRFLRQLRRSSVHFAEPFATRVLGAPEAVVVVRIASLGIPFAVVMKFTIGVVQGLQRSLPKVLIRNIGQPIVRFSLVVVSLYFGLGAAGIVRAYSATFAAAGLAGLYYVLTRTNLRSSVTANMRQRELVRFSAPLMLTAAMLMVLSYFDIFMLSYFRTSGEVGSYNVVYPLAELLTATLSAFSFIAMPILSQLHSDERITEMDRTYKVVTKWIFMATLPPMLILIFPRRRRFG